MKLYAKKYIGENVHNHRYNTWLFNFALRLNNRVKNAIRWRDHSKRRERKDFFIADINRFLRSIDRFCFPPFVGITKTKFIVPDPRPRKKKKCYKSVFIKKQIKLTDHEHCNKS